MDTNNDNNNITCHQGNNNNNASTITSSSCTTTSTSSTASTTIANNNNNNNNNDSISPYNPTCEQAQEIIIEMLHLQSNDIIFDLGCGDARILQRIILSSQHNNTNHNDTNSVRCVGIDINTIQMERAIQSIINTCTVEQQCNIQIRNESLLTQAPSSTTYNDDNIKVHQNGDDNNINNNGSIYSSIGSNCLHLTLYDDATIVYLFLLPKALVQVKQILDDVIQYRHSKINNNESSFIDNNDGSKNITKKSSKVITNKFQVVSYMFQIHGWIPKLINRTTKAGVAIYLYDHTIDA